MTNRILLASGNSGKLEELKALLNDNCGVNIISPSEFGIVLEVDEPADTLRENAQLKAQSYYKLLKIPSLADDTGLFVSSLSGAPGVQSARYSGFNATYQSNRKKLLSELKGKLDRSAEFRTVLCLCVSESEEYFFEGICKGSITVAERGTNGFGYDAIFVPDGYNETFAEMSAELKNEISHRAKALNALAEFLKSMISKLSTP